MRVEISTMSTSDLDQVMEIEESSFPTPWSRQSFVSELTGNSRACYLVARAAGRVVGYIGMWLIIDEAHITNVAVHPEARRKGVGEKLLRSAITLAKVKGAKRITLEVRVSNLAAQHLYRKIGFCEVGSRRHYYHDNDEDAIIMWKECLHTAESR